MGKLLLATGGRGWDCYLKNAQATTIKHEHTQLTHLHADTHTHTHTHTQNMKSKDQFVKQSIYMYAHHHDAHNTWLCK